MYTKIFKRNRPFHAYIKPELSKCPHEKLSGADFARQVKLLCTGAKDVVFEHFATAIHGIKFNDMTTENQTATFTSYSTVLIAKFMI